MEEALIRVNDLCKIYNPGENEVRALDHVSLSIDRGELVGIIGHSGSGKSTLMNMLGCLDVPTSGSYYLNGKDVSNLTAEENVELPLIYRGVPKKEREKLATEALKIVGARTKFILIQFLAESAIITGIGGVIGIVLGIGGAYGICALPMVQFSPAVSGASVLGATLFSCGAGIFFGIYPAKKAAHLSPIEALRRN